MKVHKIKAYNTVRQIKIQVLLDDDEGGKKVKKQIKTAYDV